MNLVLSTVIAFIISALTVPVIGKITKDLGIIAKVNERTIHEGIIPRTGGYGIYVSFLICTAIFLKTDHQINSILIGGFIIFITGFLDDIYDLPPKLKLLGQLIAALIVIFYGNVKLVFLPLPFLPASVLNVLAIIVTLGWIIGITNAINLIDGLDGLCAGISSIVLFTIAFSSLHYARTDIAAISLIMAGAILGFLLYNKHPAKIFMGDCGALFIGFMIASISLLGYGYKSTSFFTLGAPIVVLTVPIMDTLIAIVRRRLKHQRFDEADRSHLHHQLMITLQLGQVRSVLILYVATLLFSMCSYLYIEHKRSAIILFVILILAFELFVEYTDMIAREYKPLLTIVNIFLKKDDLPKIKDSQIYQTISNKTHLILRIILCIIVALAVGLGSYTYFHTDNQPSVNTVYKQSSDPTDLMKTIYKRLSKAQGEEACGYVAAYFAADYLTISNKKKDEIGGSHLFLQERLDAFTTYAKQGYYKNVNTLIDMGNKDEVVDYTQVSIGESNTVLTGLEDYNYYEVNLNMTFNQESNILKKMTTDCKVILIQTDEQYQVVSFDID